MKKIISLVFLVGCGSEDKKANDSVALDTKAPESIETAAEPEAEYKSPQTLYIATVGELPACGEDNARQLIYVAEDASFRVCGKDWAVVEIGPKEKVAESFGTWEAKGKRFQNGGYYTEVDYLTLTEMPDDQVHVVLECRDYYTAGTRTMIDTYVARGHLATFSSESYTLTFTDWHAGNQIKATLVYRANSDPLGTVTGELELTAK